jgi:hypothetical protein
MFVLDVSDALDRDRSKMQMAGDEFRAAIARDRRCGSLATHSCQSGFFLAVFPPNRVSVSFDSTKQPFATSPYRPGPVGRGWYSIAAVSAAQVAKIVVN